MTQAAKDKYLPLKDHLARAAELPEQSHVLDFSEIDRLVGGLPSAAYLKKQWWSNGNQPQAQAWQAAGWRVATVGFARQRVAFIRVVA